MKPKYTQFSAVVYIYFNLASP